MKLITYMATVFIGIGFFQVSQAFAQTDLTIQDTSGFTRSVADVGTSGKVEFVIADASAAPADGVEITLTNSSTHEVITARSVNGVVTFDNVAPGVWTVSTTTVGITFTSVTIVPKSSSKLAGAMLKNAIPPVLGLATLAGATIVIADSTGNGDHHDDPVSPAS